MTPCDNLSPTCDGPSYRQLPIFEDSPPVGIRWARACLTTAARVKPVTGGALIDTRCMARMQTRRDHTTAPVVTTSKPAPQLRRRTLERIHLGQAFAEYDTSLGKRDMYVRTPALAAASDAKNPRCFLWVDVAPENNDRSPLRVNTTTDHSNSP